MNKQISLDILIIQSKPIDVDIFKLDCEFLIPFQLPFPSLPSYNLRQQIIFAFVMKSLEKIHLVLDLFMNSISHSWFVVFFQHPSVYYKTIMPQLGGGDVLDALSFSYHLEALFETTLPK